MRIAVSQGEASNTFRVESGEYLDDAAAAVIPHDIYFIDAINRPFLFLGLPQWEPMLVPGALRAFSPYPRAAPLLFQQNEQPQNLPPARPRDNCLIGSFGLIGLAELSYLRQNLPYYPYDMIPRSPIIAFLVASPFELLDLTGPAAVFAYP